MECRVPESPAIVSGVKYNEWQRNSGLRVLRKVLDRQKLLEFESINVVDRGGGRRKLSQVKYAAWGEKVFKTFLEGGAKICYKDEEEATKTSAS